MNSLFVICLALGVIPVIKAIMAIIKESKQQAAERERQKQENQKIRQNLIQALDDVKAGRTRPMNEEILKHWQELSERVRADKIANMGIVKIVRVNIRDKGQGE